MRRIAAKQHSSRLYLADRSRFAALRSARLRENSVVNVQPANLTGSVVIAKIVAGNRGQCND
jgi:hypothetical protein